jgi:hypothetical protein
MDQPLSTMKSCRTVFFVWWNEGKGMFGHQRIEVARKYADALLSRKMVFPTLGEAILKVGKMNRMLGTGKTQDHFINTAGVHDVQLSGERSEGDSTQEGVSGEQPRIKRASPGGYSKAYRRDRS